MAEQAAQQPHTKADGPPSDGHDSHHHHHHHHGDGHHHHHPHDKHGQEHQPSATTETEEKHSHNRHDHHHGHDHDHSHAHSHGQSHEHAAHERKQVDIPAEVQERSAREDFISMTEEVLSLEAVVSRVNTTKAGAVATFTGTTRDNFNGKAVLRLEYESYVPMAEKEMRGIAHLIRVKWPEILKVAIVHRVGPVLLGEASVIIAVSSPHRRDALEAVDWAIDELKATVPVWKKEFYEDGEVWKENAECRFSRPRCCPADRPTARLRPDEKPPALGETP